VSSLSFQDVTKSISQLKDKLEGFCTEEVEKLFNGGIVPAAAHSFTLKNKSGIMKHVEESKKKLQLCLFISIVTCIETPTNEPKTREQFLQCKAF